MSNLSVCTADNTTVEACIAVTSVSMDNRTHRQLIGNGLTHRILPFQRDYAWGEEEWEDLWLDI